MDCISSLFQVDFTNSDELFQFSSLYPCQQPTIIFPNAQDHHGTLSKSPPDHHHPDIHHRTTGSPTDLITEKHPVSGGGRRKIRKASEAFGVKDDDDDDDDNPSESKKIKKVMHRDIERQRRQGMATLYASLRSLLPLEYIKGKRSISDHIHEAASYIKNMEERIQELGEKRDELKRLINPSSSSSPTICSDDHQDRERLEGSGDDRDDTLRIEDCCVGVEIAVDTSSRKGVPLSRLLGVLTQEGLNIVSCISTKVNDRMLHSIKSVVNDGRSINTSELKEKLIKSSINWSPKVLKVLEF